MRTGVDYTAVAAAVANAKQTPTGWLRTHCPLCPERAGKQDKSFSLAIQPSSWFFRCWRCHAQGHLPRPPDGSERWTPVEEQEGQFFLGLPEGFVPLHGETSMSFLVAREYLRRRGVPESTWAEAGIGAALTGLAACRIVVPIYPPGGIEWLGWAGRAWEKSADLRYRYPPGMKRGTCLFNADALLREADDPVFVVEGVFDALPHWPNAVACLGKPTQDQIELMCQSSRRIVVALDGDAWTEGEALAMRLQLEQREAVALRLPPCTDPGDFSRAELCSMARLLLGAA